MFLRIDETLRFALDSSVTVTRFSMDATGFGVLIISDTG